MKRLKLWRTFQEGTRNFKRNGWLTAATIVVLTLSLFIVSLTTLLGITTNLILENMQEKININVAFNPEVEEEKILTIKAELEKYREIASVEYTSREQALDEFLGNGGDNQVITQALEEIGENPLFASLTVRAKDPTQYDLINQAIKQSSFRDEISDINYEKNKTVINRLNAIKENVKKVGFVLGSVFIAIALLITFNTIRINMHSRRNEFEIMRLVGASNLYVRMPSVFEGVFYGLSASVITILLLFGTVQFVVAPITKNAIPQGDLSNYYMSNIVPIVFLVTLLGVSLGAMSGFVAVRKYLKV
jgi:cell division transport system permease protein